MLILSSAETSADYSSWRNLYMGVIALSSKLFTFLGI